MKRDFDLIRNIMLAMEEHTGRNPLGPENVPGYDTKDVIYNMILMEDAGLIKLAEGSSFSSQLSFAIRLTWDGHEFLDSAREEETWEEAKSTVLERAGSITFELIKTLLIEAGKRAVFPT